MCSSSKIYTFIKKNGNFFHFRLTQRWVFDIFFLKWGRKPHNCNCWGVALRFSWKSPPSPVKRGAGRDDIFLTHKYKEKKQ